MAAASIVKLAAELTGDFDVRPVLEKLKEELIFEEWQFEYLDAQQWRMLGVPMGVVASIKRCMVERKPKLPSPTPSAIAIPVAREATEDRIECDTINHSFSSPHRPPRHPFGTMEDTPLTMPQRRDSASVVSAVYSGAIESEYFVGSDHYKASLSMNSPPMIPVRAPSVVTRGVSASSGTSWEDDVGRVDSLDDFSELLNSSFGDIVYDSSLEPSKTISPTKTIFTVQEPLSAWIQRILNISEATQVVVGMTSPQQQQQLDLDVIRQSLVRGVEIKTRRYRMKDYPNCFVASELIDFMVRKGWTQTRDEAVRLGQNLQFQFQWFEHVVEPRRHWFVDKYLFFKFNNPDDLTSNLPQVLPTRMFGMPSHRQPSLSSLNEVSEHSSLES